jgi:toxin ParE1/3/4
VAHRVVWSAPALDDVDAVAVYIARDSSSYAAAVARRIIEATRQLRDFPHSGRTLPELDDESIRELLVYSYRIIYRVQAEVVTIAAVVHAKQSFATGIARVQSRDPSA